MEKRILLPTDFSKNALNAIRYALSLYEEQQCDFYFLNVYQVDGYNLENAMMVPEPGEIAFEAARSKSKLRFNELKQILSLSHHNQKHTYHTISTFSYLFEAVENAIAKHDIDIVVMGTKGSTGSHTIIYGTNTINLMEKVTECPVLAIPEKARYSTPREIVFPTDYKTPFKRRELNYLVEIGKMHGTAIRILHIKEKEKLTKAQQNNKELLENILKDIDHSSHSLEGVKVHTGINAFIESRKSDMVAFLNKKHRFFGSMWSKPLVKELGYHSRVPVFTLNDHS
ncbi:universal stress protein [uncultured Kriegella sp.]|uniref:universal stress protein n=1 Tax=uncultured Kriegella sp. TaxID=1798910 RepID=UPI0030D95189|tara:strand:- start:57082 stop:57933 length:852 start_codon:yes stop_codon:yes gene_type:complete